MHTADLLRSWILFLTLARWRERGEGEDNQFYAGIAIPGKKCCTTSPIR